MNVELVSTGSEILLGDITNTNAAWLAQELNKRGYGVIFQSTVGDNLERMKEVLRIAGNRSDIVLVTGGLGPTQGDITRNALGAALGIPLEENAEALQIVRDFFVNRHIKMPPSSNQEGVLPKGSTILRNPVGVAPGVALEHEGTLYMLIPGPPVEAKGMFLESVVPFLHDRFGEQGIILSRHFYVYDIPEATLEIKLKDFIERQGNPTIALLIKEGYIEVRVTAKGQNAQEVNAILDPWEEELTQVLGDSIGTVGSRTMIEELGQLLLKHEASVSTAESCTGGLIGKRITDMPGSSQFYEGGVISYSNAIKEHVLGVKAESLSTYGAVSEIVACQMAEGVRNKLGTSYGISTTGIAGPDGATDSKPVGLVYIAIAGPSGTDVYKKTFIGDREAVRNCAAEMALYYLRKHIMEIIK